MQVIALNGVVHDAAAKSVACGCNGRNQDAPRLDAAQGR
jgi:hypothetical protein